MSLFGKYKGLFEIFSRYWTGYGGWKEFALSPFVHFSIILTMLSHNYWGSRDWTELPLELLPNLLGFSLGTYALIFSLANERLLAALSLPRKNGALSLLEQVNSTFFHFIIVQAAAILFALINKSTSLIDALAILFGIGSHNLLIVGLQNLAGAFGYWLTIYAVSLLIAAAIAAYRFANKSGAAANRGARLNQIPSPANSVGIAPNPQPPPTAPPP